MEGFLQREELKANIYVDIEETKCLKKGYKAGHGGKCL